MPLHIETFRSSRTPWEVFQAVHSVSKVCFFLDSPNTSQFQQSGNWGNPDNPSFKKNKSQDSHGYVPPDQVYSCIGMDPALEIRLGRGRLTLSGEEKGRYPASELFSVFRKILKKYQDRSPPKPFFTGGFVGYFGYEVAALCDKIKFRSRKGTGLPELYFGLFRDVVVYDHKKKVYYLVMNSRDPHFGTRDSQKLKNFFKKPVQKNGKFQLKKFSPGMSKNGFRRMVKRTKEYIAAGDIYQANLSQRFDLEFRGSALTLYDKLRSINPSPFSSFFKAHDLQILSSSPERLIRKKGRVCETRPIAGTCQAYGAEKKTREWRQRLLQNPKERAEHLMLVDLERNDLGRVCDYRSVKVEEFMTLEKYSHVVHIVSKITGRLQKGKDAFDLIKAMFPGGTITGCPKIRCMEIIDELEPVRRGIYTGSLGYVGLRGDMDLNIVIRTLVLKGDRGHLQVGAGIVWDSNPGKEYEETLHKGEALVKALTEAGNPQ